VTGTMTANPGISSCRAQEQPCSTLRVANLSVD